MSDEKVVIIGLDCAPPELVFDEFTDVMPCVSSLMRRGAYARLESTIPPITVPAWTSMMSGKDPGELGCYGFRNRKDHTYTGLSIAMSTAIKEDRVWDIIGRHGKKSILLGVPQTFPPKPINGWLVGCFLTPSTKSEYTYPPALKHEIEEVSGGYMIDVEDFRTEDKQRVLDDIFLMTEKRFKVARHLITTRPWDFFMMVEMGVDRIHHGFWRYHDKRHNKYVPGSPFESAISNYYAYLDREIGALLALVPDETTVIVVSDHGVKRMDGGICINEWLIREGLLTLGETPTEPTPLAKAGVDWSKTVAWGEGGYYSRVFINVKGREPEGVVEPGDYEKVRDELIEKIEALGDDKGNPIGTRAYKPQQIYKTCKGIPPDLVVILGDLFWRSVGSVGMGGVHTFENDTGPDDANHAQHGIFIMGKAKGDLKGPGLVEDMHIMDVAPTVLDILGIEIPSGMGGVKANFESLDAAR